MGTIFNGHLEEDFFLIEELEYLSLLLSTCPKIFNNNRILLFDSIYSYVIEAPYLNSSSFIWIILATILLILLSMILSKLSLYKL